MSDFWNRYSYKKKTEDEEKDGEKESLSFWERYDFRAPQENETSERSLIDRLADRGITVEMPEPKTQTAATEPTAAQNGTGLTLAEAAAGGKAPTDIFRSRLGATFTAQEEQKKQEAEKLRVKPEDITDDQRKAYSDYYSSLRSEEDIRAELDEAKKTLGTSQGQRRAYLETALTGNILNTTADAEDYLAYVAEQTGEKAASEKVKALEDELAEKQYADYQRLKYEPDFLENSEYKEEKKREPSYNPISGEWDTGYDDNIYEAVNGNDDVRDALVINSMAGKDLLGQLVNFDDKTYVNHMSEDEVRIYNYLHKKDGPEAANQYLAFLQSDLYARQMQKQKDEASAYAEEHPVLSTLGTIALSPLRGASFLGQTADFLTTGSIDQNAPYNKAAALPAAARETVTKTVERNWGKVGTFAYGVGVSMAEFLLNTAISGGNQALSLALMGTDAAADATIEAKDRGLEDWQAFTLGTIAGAAEIITEKVSIEALFSDPGGKPWKYLLKNIFEEGREEASSDIINLVADVLITKDKSEWAESMRELQRNNPGMTEDEAFIQVLKNQGLQILYDAAAGGVSGGIMALPGSFKAFAQIAQDRSQNIEAAREAVKAARTQNTQKGPAIEIHAAQNQTEGSTPAQGSGTTDGNIVLPTAADTETESGDTLRFGTEPEGRSMTPTAEEAEINDAVDKAAAEGNLTRATGIRYGIAEKTIKWAERMGEMTGHAIQFYDGQLRNGAVENGFTKPNGEIFLNKNAKQPFAFTFAHEFTHNLEGTDAYREMMDHVKTRAAETGIDWLQERTDKKALYERATGQQVSAEYLDQEILADWIGDNLSDERTIREICRENPSAAKKIRDALDSFIIRAADAGGVMSEYEKEKWRNVVGMIEKYVGEANRGLERNAREAQAAQDAETPGMTDGAAFEGQESPAEYLARMEDLYDAGEITEEEYEEAQALAAEMESTGRGIESSTVERDEGPRGKLAEIADRVRGRYSLSEEQETRKHQYDYNTLVQKKDVEIVPIVTRNLPAKRNRLKLQEISGQVRNEFSVLSNNGYRQRYIYIPDVEKNALVIPDTIKHGIGGTTTRASTMDTAQVTYYMPQILRNSVAINELNPRSKADGEYSQILFGYAEDENGNGYLIKSTLNHFGENKSIIDDIEIFDVVKGIKAKKIAAEVIGDLSNQGEGLTRNATASNISIAQLLDLVKDIHPEFLSDDVRKHYGIEGGIRADGLRHSLSPVEIEQRNEDYMRAVEEGDTEEAQRMVDGAAIRNGYTYRRNTRSVLSPVQPGSVPWTMFVEGSILEWANDEFDHDQLGYGENEYVATDAGALDIEDIYEDIQNLAEEFYGERIDDESINPPDIVDSAGIWDDPEFVQYMWDNYFEQIMDRTGEAPSVKTNDGLIFLSGIDSTDKIKSLAPVTYDDGNVIPLSKRFNREERDIRYSLSEGNNDLAGMSQTAKSAALRIERQLASDVLQGFLRNVNPNSAEFRQFRADVARPVIEQMLRGEKPDVDAVLESTGIDVIGQAAARGAVKDALRRASGEIGRIRTAVQQTNARQEAREARNAELDARIPDTSAGLVDLANRTKDARNRWNSLRARTILTDEDLDLAHKIATGQMTEEEMRAQIAYGQDEIAAMAEAEKEYLDANAPWERYTKRLMQQRYEQADARLENADQAKDKASGFQYARETPERNFRDVFGKDAPALIDDYIRPIHRAEAASTRFKNEYNRRVKELGLSQKVAHGNSSSEAAAVQFLGEAEDNVRVLELARGYNAVRDGKTLEEWKSEIEAFKNANPNLDYGKVRRGIEEFQKIYNELITRMNEVLVENGYMPVNVRRGYFPHFNGGSDGVLATFAHLLGINIDTNALPTAINGLTSMFKPGKPWFSHAMERTGFATDYDALQGFDGYLGGVSDVIHQTPNIRNLRALGTRIRYQMGDDQIRRRIDEINADDSRTEQEKLAAITDLTENGRYKLSRFVSWLDEYTNMLANKKSRYDRGVEDLMGRRVYTWMKNIEGRVAANMIAGNLGSALTNFIPLNQAGAMLGDYSMLRGAFDTMTGHARDDGFVQRSDFLTNRRGVDPLLRTSAQKLSDVLSAPMNLIDDFASEVIVRAAYGKYVRQGMDEQSAMQAADEFAAGVMADRSKGALPTAFGSHNPLMKLFTQFQVEVNNEFSTVFKDIPKGVHIPDRDKKNMVAVAAWTLLRYFIGAYLFNDLYEKFVGRRAALDPLDILNDAVGDLTGKKLNNVFDMLTEGVFDDQKRTNPSEAIMSLGTNTLEELPFIGGLLGGGRIPISSALPDAETIVKGIANENWSGAKKAETVGRELGKTIGTYWIPPFAGGLGRKLYQTAENTIRGGRYVKDSQGNDQLQYPYFTDTPLETAGTIAKSALFGPTATEGGRDWVEGGFGNQSAKNTALYQHLTQDLGESQRAAWDLVSGMTGLDALGKKIAVSESALTDEGKAEAMAAVVSDSERAKFRAAYENGISADVWASFWRTLPNYDADGNRSYKQAEVTAALDNVRVPLTVGEGAAQGLFGGSTESRALTRAEKAVIWSAYNPTWKTANNPFDAGIGERVVGQYGRYKEEDGE